VRLSKDELVTLSGLLDTGLDLPQEARRSWVDELAEPFAGAKALLRELLEREASGKAEDFLDTLPKFPTAGDEGSDSAHSGLQPGARIGVYVLVREIGQGGMATVWLARRTDELVNRPVALKLPHLHLQTARFAARFNRERDILAELTHPHIAHLYDAGITAEGQPFLAMEFVVGETLTDYCTAHELTMDARLQLFLQVLAAVDYAHKQGIIHRDLKPSNILVRPDAQAVLLDFGIAKLLADGQEGDGEATLQGGAALTPHFASPEQIKGEILGPATDVYSLGVVLYELLTGKPPYGQSFTSRRKLEEAILSTDPRRPSDVVTERAQTAVVDPVPENLRTTWSRDLDTIVLKALKKSAADRYPTAGIFAEDLRRYLRREPVSAQPDSSWYRFKKLAHRHQSALQGAAVAALAIVAVLGVGAVKGGWFTSHTDSQLFSSPTLSISPKSVAVLPFVDLSEKQDQGYLSDGLSEELIDRLSNISELRVPARTSSFYFKGKQVTIADIGKTLQVANVLEGSVRRAGDQLRITVQLIDAASGFHRWSQTYQRDLKDVLQVQADVANSIAQALKVSLSGDDMAKIGSGGTSDSMAYDAYLRAEQRLGAGEDRKGDNTAALALFDQAIALDPNYALAHAGRARALDTLAIFHSDSKERESVRSQALAAGQRAVALAPELGETHAALAITLAYGLLDFRAAEPEFARALALAPGNARVQRLYAEYSSAIGHHEQAIAAAQRAVSLDPQDVGSHMTLGRTLHNSHRHVEALVAYRDAEVLKPDSNFVEGNIASAMIAAGQLEPARQRCESQSVALSDDNRRWCLSLVYHLLGRQTDAKRELAELMNSEGDEAAFAYAEIYATWGDIPAALTWLTIASRQRNPGLQSIRILYWLDPLRAYPEFKVIEAQMNFPP
jgi:serine/threonine protein kinase/tetratricopeptide (TPR) repeat protein